MKKPREQKWSKAFLQRDEQTIKIKKPRERGFLVCPTSTSMLIRGFRPTDMILFYRGDALCQIRFNDLLIIAKPNALIIILKA
jgi:hypothetical protein